MSKRCVCAHPWTGHQTWCRFTPSLADTLDATRKLADEGLAGVSEPLTVTTAMLLEDAAIFLDRVSADTGYVGARAWAIALRNATRTLADEGLAGVSEPLTEWEDGYDAGVVQGRYLAALEAAAPTLDTRLRKAVEAHVAWQYRVRAAMSEPLTPEEEALLRESCGPDYPRLPMPERTFVVRLLATLDATRNLADAGLARDGLDVALAEAVVDCCSYGYAGVACDDHIALRAALADLKLRLHE